MEEVKDLIAQVVNQKNESNPNGKEASQREIRRNRFRQLGLRDQKKKSENIMRCP